MKTTKMKLLLVYPQQADRPNRRVSRAGAQLNGITQTARALLARGTATDLHVQEFAYEKSTGDNTLNPASVQKGLSSILDDTDVVIDVSLTPETHIPANDFAGPIIHLSPTFSGSFACNDITIKGCGRLQQSDVVQCVERSDSPSLTNLPSTHELDEDMHYAAFSPLPTRVGDAFYRTEKDHALVFLSYPEHLRNEQIIETDMLELNKVLHTVENLRSITFICECLDDVPLIQKVADGLKQALGVKANIWGLRKGEFHDLFSIMAKSSVVLFGGGSLFADAIIRGIPVYPWRNHLAGTENIAHAYRQFSTDRKTDRNVLLRAQRKHLNRLIEAQYLDATISNNRISFDKVLTTLINHAVHSNQFSIDPAKESHMEHQPDWVIQPARMAAQRSLPDRLSRSVWSDRQHLLQFKQTTNRRLNE